jgi:very-short-patch-repair endonuclease
MQNWAMCKKLSASARFFLRSGGIHLYGFLLIPRYNHDKIREEFMKSLGIKTLRFSNNEIHNNIEGVLLRITEFI